MYMHKWIKDRLLLIGIISSILFALIIHCLFSEPAPNEWLVAKWEPGDILTYVSTIALGLLAVWQNKKFKEENDNAQQRMETLATKTNELALVSKVIEYERSKISQLKLKSRNFIDSCNTENASLDIADVANQPDDFKKTYVKVKMDGRCSQIRLWSIELLYELDLYNTDANVAELSRLISEYSNASLALVQEIRTNTVVESTYHRKKELEKQFLQNIFNFISSREQLLNKVIYGDFSFSQIKKMYGQLISKNILTNK